MATRLDDKPDQKSDNKSQEHYDKEFNRLTSPDHMSKQTEDPNLYSRESTPDTDGGAPLEPWEQAKLDQMEAGLREEHLYQPEPKKKRFRFKKNRKKIALGAGILGIIGGSVGVLYVFLPSLKVAHVLNNIEGRFYGFASNAIEQRAEKLLSKYMRDAVFPTVKCGRVVSSDCYTYNPGAGIASNLYRNWRNARVETRLFDKHGIKIDWVEGTNDYTITTRNAASVVVDGKTFDFSYLHRSNTVGALEVERSLKNALDNETFWKKLMLRGPVRKLSNGKYSVRWCLIACETRNKIREYKISALQKLKLNIIERTVSPFSDRLGVYLACAVGNCSNKEFLSQRTRVIGRAIEELGQEEVTKIASSIGDRRLSQVIVDKIFSRLFNEAVGKTASAAVPVVGLVYITDALNQLDIKLYNGEISQFLADSIAAQYAEFYLTYKTNFDEAIAGKLTVEEVGAQSQLLDGLGDSLVYQKELGSGSVASTTADSSYTCSDGQPIPDGQLVCEERKVGKLSSFDAWRQNGAVEAVSAIIFGGYRCGFLQLAQIVSGENCPPANCPQDLPAADCLWPVDSVIHGIFQAFGSILDVVSSALLNLVPQTVLDWANERIQDLTDILLKYVFHFAGAGTGPGRQVFDDLYAGADVVGNEFTKGFENPLTGEFTGLGGRKLTDQEIEDNLAYYRQSQEEEFKSKSLFARLFSPDEPKSLLSTVAMTIPGSPSDISEATQSLASFINPMNLIAQASSAAVNPIYAQQETQYSGDPFGIHQYGYSVGDEMLDIDPEELTPEACSPGGDIYEAWLDGIQEKTVDGQIVNETANPCMLEYVTSNILGCWFTESDDCGAGNSNIITAANDAGIAGNPSPVAGLVSSPSLGPVLANGYYRMPAAPNGEYDFWSATPAAQQCGSRALVDLIYTVSVRWNLLHPDDRILVGDLNAVGHQSHMNGVDWDIWLESSDANGSFATNDKAKQLGRLLADTGIVKLIYYNVTDVQNDFNTYVAQNSLSGSMVYSDGHFNHMHLRINDEYRGTTSTSCNSGTAALDSFSPLAAIIEEIKA